MIETVPVKEGVLDQAKLKEAVDREAKLEGEYLASLTGSGQVLGMGTTAPTPIDAKEAERRAQADKDEHASAVRVFESLGMPKAAAELAAKGRAA